MWNQRDPEAARRGSHPSLRDLAGLRTQPSPLPGWEDLYRQIGRLSGVAGSDTEVLDLGWGAHEPLRLLVEEFGVRVTGIEPDASSAEAATLALAGAGFEDRAQVQEAPIDALPYRDGVFDLAVAGELVAVQDDPALAIKELSRVVRPGGSIVLCQWVWRAPLTEDERRTVVDHLGVEPRALSEWRDALSAAGVRVGLTEHWAGAGPGLGSGPVPRPTLGDMFPFRERLVLLRKALLRWGSEAVRALLARDRAVRTILTRSAAVDLCVIRGVRTEDTGPAEDARPGDEAGMQPEDDLSLFESPSVTGEPKAPPPELPVSLSADSDEETMRAGRNGAAPAGPEPQEPPALDVDDLPLFSMDRSAP